MQVEDENGNKIEPTEAQVVEIPYQRLAAETLQAVIEEYITRDGTDYGEIEMTLQKKVARALRQLERGEVKINFYPKTAHCQIVEV